MNLTFFKKLFSKETPELPVVDSVLVQKLKTVADINKFDLFTNATIYHHTQSHSIPLMLLDIQRGLYLFETKTWNYDELKNATIQKAQNQETQENTLAFQKKQNILHTKFNELLHHDGIEIHNYLLMENLATQEYENLDDSFLQLLPKNRIIFSDTTEEEIFEKLKDVALLEQPPRKEDILGNLFIQYTIVQKESSLELLSYQQREFIDTDLQQHTILNGVPSSGKSATLLLKALTLKLQNPQKKVLIIKPTRLSADIFKKQLLETIEHAIVEVDLSEIQVLTPLELINQHLLKLKKEPLVSTFMLDEILLKKSFYAADYLLCDDSELMPNRFVEYLKQIQQNKPLVLVTTHSHEYDFFFNTSYIKEHREVFFLQTHPYAKTLQLVAKLLQDNAPEDILVVCNTLNKEKLSEDLEHFIEHNTTLLNSSKNLLDQSSNSLLLATFSETVELQPKHIILLDICSANKIELQYAFNLASDTIYLLYEEECDIITTLKENYESSKN